MIAVGGSLYLHRAVAAEAAKLLEHLAQYHRQSPESPGMTAEQLRQACGWQKPVWDAVVALLKSTARPKKGTVPICAKHPRACRQMGTVPFFGRVVEQNQRLALGGHQATFQDQDARQLEAVESLFRQQLFSPPGVAEVADKTGLPAAKLGHLLRTLQEHQRLVAVGEGMLFHRDAVEQARQRSSSTSPRKGGWRASILSTSWTRREVRPAAVGLLRPRRIVAAGGQHAVPEVEAGVRLPPGEPAPICRPGPRSAHRQLPSRAKTLGSIESLRN